MPTPSQISSTQIQSTTVTAGSYTLANFTVNAEGQITAASSTSTTGTGSAVLASSPTFIPSAAGNIGLTLTGLSGQTGDLLHVMSNGGSMLFKLANNGAVTVGTWNGTAIGANYGGTGQTSYAVGDLLYASTTTALSPLHVGTNGYMLTMVSGLPAWVAAPAGSITSIIAGTGLSGGTITTTGTVALANTAVTPGSYTLSNFTVNAQGQITAASSPSTTGTGNVVLANTPTLTTPVLGAATATSINGVTITGAGTLSLPSGSTLTTAGAYGITFTATATTSLTLPVSGTLLTSSSANTFTATQTFSGSTSVVAQVLTNAAEVATVSATAATGTINFYVSSQSVLYYTTNASANWTTNISLSSGITLDTSMTAGQSLTLAFLVTQGSTAYYNSAITVDGYASGAGGYTFTVYWQGGTAPTTGNASGIDVYSYTLIKTATKTFSILASQVQF